MPAREETPEERRVRWMAKEAEKAEMEKPTKAKCAGCGKDVEEGEFIEFHGEIFCDECYAEKLEESMDMGAADGSGAG